MRLLLLQVFISAVYIFDVSAYPFVHVPLYVLTALYFGSVLEMYGLSRLVKFLSRRFSGLRRSSNLSRMLPASPVSEASPQ